MLKCAVQAEKGSSACEHERHFDAMSGELLDEALIKEARKVEMETLKNHAVCV